MCVNFDGVDWLDGDMKMFGGSVETVSDITMHAHMMHCMYTYKISMYTSKISTRNWREISIHVRTHV
jgi:hypothetical protein